MQNSPKNEMPFLIFYNILNMIKLQDKIPRKRWNTLLSTNMIMAEKFTNKFQIYFINIL